MGISNDIVFYLKKNFSRFTNLLSDNLSISNYEVDTINNVATITTSTNHNLKVNHYVFIDNVFYSYSIDEIITIDSAYSLYGSKYERSCLKISISDAFFNPIQEQCFFEIYGLTTNTNLNTQYKIVKSEILQDENYDNVSCVFYCLPLDSSIDIANINITNKGKIKIKYTDDVVVTPTNNSNSFGSIFRISGCYNGFKIVKTIINETSFTIDLLNYQVRPEYSDVIEFSNGVCKKNIKVYPYNISDFDKGMEKVYSEFKDVNETKGCMFISREYNSPSNNGTSFDSTTESITSGIDIYNEDISFKGVLLFRVQRDLTVEGSSHYVMSGEANDVVDELFRFARFLINNYFVDVESNYLTKTTSNVLYRSISSSFGSIDSYNSTENSVFKKVDFNFKVSRQVSGYNTDSINIFGLPIKNINVNLDYKNNDNINVKIN